MRKIMGALLGALCLGALAVGVGGGAVTNADGTYVNRSTVVTDLGRGVQGVDTTLTNGPAVQLGNVRLMATGTNTKTFVVGGVGCGNVSMNWDDSPGGSAYLVSKESSWNAAGNCGGAVNGSLDDLDLIANDGTWLHTGPLADGDTYPWYRISTGTATTKAKWSYQDGGGLNRVACGVLIPGGGGLWYPNTSC